MKLERKELGQMASKSRRNFRCGAGGQQLILGSILRRGGRHRGHGCAGKEHLHLAVSFSACFVSFCWRILLLNFN